MAEKKIIIITAPSGAGKTSITHFLLNKYPNLAFSISAATRNARGNEKNGIDYYFISVQDFQQKIKNNEFVEWEMVYEGKYYGTLKSEIDRIWGENKTPILDIDVKGAIHVQQQFPNNTFSMFIMAPTIEELERRLKTRGTETTDSINTRINKATYEMSFKDRFDRVIINGSLDSACINASNAIEKFLNQ